MTMKWWAVCASCVLLVSVADARAAKKKNSPYSMTGCLQRGDHDLYRLTGVEGGGVKTIEIARAAKGVNLGAHVGHRIEITGTTVNAKKAAKVSGKKKKDVQTVRSELHMRVESVKMLAPGCSPG